MLASTALRLPVPSFLGIGNLTGGIRRIAPKESTMRSNPIPWTVLVAAAFLVLASPPARSSASLASQEPKPQQDLVREVRHQLVLLPYYSVFDNLSFKVEGGKVTLLGQVVRPTLKSDSENVVKRIDGVTSVVNEIEVLPASPMDDQLRRALYRAIYSDPSLFRYAQSAVPSIHIIVKSGNVTLEGVADNDTDKNLAALRANGVANVFSVKNNLVVVGNDSK
jgi:hyperosmotically inducible protein